MNPIPIKTILIILKEFCVFIYKRRKNIVNDEKPQVPDIDELIADLDKEQVRPAILTNSPTGLIPKQIFIHARIKEIVAVMYVCAMDNKSIPREWIIELDEWCQYLKNEKKGK